MRTLPPLSPPEACDYALKLAYSSVQPVVDLLDGLSPTIAPSADANITVTEAYRKMAAVLAPGTAALVGKNVLGRGKEENAPITLSGDAQGGPPAPPTPVASLQNAMAQYLPQQPTSPAAVTGIGVTTQTGMASNAATNPINAQDAISMSSVQ